MGLYFPNKCMEGLVGFADARYLSNPHNGRSQTGYVFMCGGASISVTLQLKDNIECKHLMCVPRVVAHISRQINRSIITVYIHNVITSRSSYITSEKGK
jgi:hypothetical protein